MTTVTLRPNADTSLGSGVTVVGTVSPYIALSDNSDTTYCSLAAPGGYVIVALGTTALPAGAVTKTITPRYRAALFGASSICVVKMSTFASLAKVYETTAYVTTNNGSGASTPVSLTQTEIDNLQLGLQLQLPTDSGTGLFWYEAYLDLTYATKPTVTANTPGTSSSAPTLSHSYTQGSDGGPQAYYQYKLFTSAVYGAGGFSADTSSAAYDSGIVAGAATTGQASGLANATTYKLYVRAAQVINGAAHWSDWAASSAFTTSFTTANVNTVTATATNASGYISVAVTRSGATAWQAVTVERSFDSGVTWEWVRGATAKSATNAFLTWGASTVTVLDYEVGNGVSVMYRARAFTNASGSDVWGAWVSSAATSWTDSTAYWLKNPHDPTKNTKLAFPRYLSGMRRTWMPNNHDVAGRDKPIVVSSSVMKSINGTTQFTTETSAATSAFLALVSSTPVVLLQFPASDLWGSRYLSGLSDIVEDRPVEVTGHGARSWEVAFVEVDRPADETA